jgi:hypothetical protein
MQCNENELGIIIYKECESATKIQGNDLKPFVIRTPSIYPLLNIRVKPDLKSLP